MSHHGPNPFDVYDDGTKKRMRELLQDTHRKAAIGPTKQFPDGKLTEHDEGEIAFAIGHREGKVILDFGSPVAWVGMSPQQAIALASSLISHAKNCRIIGSKSQTRHKATAKTS